MATIDNTKINVCSSEQTEDVRESAPRFDISVRESPDGKARMHDAMSYREWELDPFRRHDGGFPRLVLNARAMQMRVEWERAPFDSACLVTELPRDIRADFLEQALAGDLMDDLLTVAKGYVPEQGFDAEALWAWRRIEAKVADESLLAQREDWLDVRGDGAVHLVHVGRLDPWSSDEDVRWASMRFSGGRPYIGLGDAERKAKDWIERSRKELDGLAERITLQELDFEAAVDAAILIDSDAARLANGSDLYYCVWLDEAIQDLES